MTGSARTDRLEPGRIRRFGPAKTPGVSVVQRQGHAAWALPSPSDSVEYGKIEYGGLPVNLAVFIR